MWQSLLQKIQQGQFKELARAISLVENEVPGYIGFLQQLPHSDVPVIGITGPPGAGKSTLTDALIAYLVAQQKKVAVLCIDPSSPFNRGALLGDRIRMSEWYNNPNVFIRSMASRGSLGGLHPNIIEVTDVVKAGGFDYVVIETVGVGQSEIEIVGLADITVLVLVPEAGDDIQTMKAGLMEIADIFVVNKADRPNADLFVHNLRQYLLPGKHAGKTAATILKTVALQKQGIDELGKEIEAKTNQPAFNSYKSWLLAEKAWRLISAERMKNIDRIQLQQSIEQSLQTNQFNLYGFVANYTV